MTYLLLITVIFALLFYKRPFLSFHLSSSLYYLFTLVNDATIVVKFLLCRNSSNRVVSNAPSSEPSVLIKTHYYSVTLKGKQSIRVVVEEPPRGNGGGGDSIGVPSDK